MYYYLHIFSKRSLGRLHITLLFLDRGIIAVLKEMMNFKLLCNPLFLLIGISNAVGMIGFYTPFVYLPSMAAQYVRTFFVNVSVNDRVFIRMESVLRTLLSWCPS